MEKRPTIMASATSVASKCRKAHQSDFWLKGKLVVIESVPAGVCRNAAKKSLGRCRATTRHADRKSQAPSEAQDHDGSCRSIRKGSGLTLLVYLDGNLFADIRELRRGLTADELRKFKGRDSRQLRFPGSYTLCGFVCLDPIGETYEARRSVYSAIIVSDGVLHLNFNVAAFGATEGHRMMAQDGKRLMHVK